MEAGGEEQDVAHPSVWFVDEIGFPSTFYDLLLNGAEDGHFEPEWLLGMMCSESGLNPKAYNKHGGAAGLSQLMPSVLRNLGWVPGNIDFEACGGVFQNLPAERQIPWTLKYFEMWRKHALIVRWQSRAHMYLCNFLPALLSGGMAPDRILVRHGAPCALSGLMSQARIDLIYEQNRGLDQERKGYITPGDLEASIEHATRCVKPKYDVALASLAKAKGAREPTDPEIPSAQPVTGHEDEDMQASVPDDPVCKPS